MNKLFGIVFILLWFFFAPLKADKILEIKGHPEQGYFFPYLIYIPETVKTDANVYLMVEPNNTGKVNDDLNVHYQAVKNGMERKSFSVRFAYKLGIPLLRPVFPRSKSNWRMYTHALDRDTIKADKAPLKRIDLQLLAMIEDCRKRLKKEGIVLKDKIFMNGFSASGTFINRFVFLHPKSVKAAAAGGLNGILILPLKRLAGEQINFPLGVGDYKMITGHRFKVRSINQVRQFLYMGELDTNDATLYDDGYDRDEQNLVHSQMGKAMIPDRWEFCKQMYRKKKIKIEFNTYRGIGHGTNSKINNEILKFFQSVISGAQD